MSFRTFYIFDYADQLVVLYIHISSIKWVLYLCITSIGKRSLSFTHARIKDVCNADREKIKSNFGERAKATVFTRFSGAGITKGIEYDGWLVETPPLQTTQGLLLFLLLLLCYTILLLPTFMPRSAHVSAYFFFFYIIIRRAKNFTKVSLYFIFIKCFMCSRDEEINEKINFFYINYTYRRCYKSIINVIIFSTIRKLVIINCYQQ